MGCFHDVTIVGRSRGRQMRSQRKAAMMTSRETKRTTVVLVLVRARSFFIACEVKTFSSDKPHDGQNCHGPSSAEPSTSTDVVKEAKVAAAGE
jgi:hypothetical protein